MIISGNNFLHVVESFIAIRYQSHTNPESSFLFLRHVIDIFEAISSFSVHLRKALQNFHIYSPWLMNTDLYDIANTFEMM